VISDGGETKSEERQSSGEMLVNNNVTLVDWRVPCGLSGSPERLGPPYLENRDL
jgi:hypothetical protein